MITLNFNTKLLEADALLIEALRCWPPQFEGWDSVPFRKSDDKCLELLKKSVAKSKSQVDEVDARHNGAGGVNVLFLALYLLKVLKTDVWASYFIDGEGIYTSNSNLPWVGLENTLGIPIMADQSWDGLNVELDMDQKESVIQIKDLLKSYRLISPVMRSASLPGNFEFVTDYFKLYIEMELMSLEQDHSECALRALKHYVRLMRHDHPLCSEFMGKTLSTFPYRGVLDCLIPIKIGYSNEDGRVGYAEFLLSRCACALADELLGKSMREYVENKLSIGQKIIDLRNEIASLSTKNEGVIANLETNAKKDHARKEIRLLIKRENLEGGGKAFGGMDWGFYFAEDWDFGGSMVRRKVKTERENVDTFKQLYWGGPRVYEVLDLSDLSHLDFLCLGALMALGILADFYEQEKIADLRYPEDYTSLDHTRSVHEVEANGYVLLLAEFYGEQGRHKIARELLDMIVIRKDYEIRRFGTQKVVCKEELESLRNKYSN